MIYYLPLSISFLCLITAGCSHSGHDYPSDLRALIDSIQAKPQIGGEPRIRFNRSGEVVDMDLNNINLTDAEWELLVEFDTIKRLNIMNSNITDSQIRSLAGLQNLRLINFSDTPISKQTLNMYKNHDKIEVVNLANTSLDNESVDILLEFSEIERLNLSGTKIDNQSVANLKHFKRQLKELDIRDTNITKDALVQLKQNLPNTKILADSIP